MGLQWCSSGIHGVSGAFSGSFRGFMSVPVDVLGYDESGEVGPRGVPEVFIELQGVSGAFQECSCGS